MVADNASQTVGEQLLTALTSSEISGFLDALLQMLPQEQLEQSFAQLSSDTQETIRQIINPPQSTASVSTTASSPTSLAKLAQTWTELWQEWDAIVWEASEEEGNYIEQEAHWEPPYFDNYAFAEDLDKVAEKMQPLVQVAFDHDFSPERGFAPALLEAEAEVAGGLPEWMEIMDGICLEKHVTQCLLQWEWLTAQQQGQDAFQFVQHVRQLSSDFSEMGLDDNALIAFLCDLPEPDQRNILTGLSDAKDHPPWNHELSNTHSPWQWFYREAINQFSPKLYLDNLRVTIAQRWTDGLPVIEDLLAQKNYAESLSVIHETLASLMSSRYHRDAEWTPETSLLFTLVSGYYHDQDYFDNEKTLLAYYQQTAQGLKQPKLVNALKIQQVAFDSCFDWQTMFQAFTDVPVSKKTHQALFQSWRDYIIKRATPHRSYVSFGSRSVKEVGWLHWLIDSIADSKKGVSWFQKQITKWLANLPDNSTALGDDFERLRLLTHDLNVIQGRKRASYPMFDQVVIRLRELSAPDDESRRTYLKQFAPQDLGKQVMKYWQDHLQNFVPDPRSAHKSDYTNHANWMAALKEVAPNAYKRLLTQWETDHIRRSNLWKAMKKMGLG